MGVPVAVIACPQFRFLFANVAIDPYNARRCARTQRVRRNVTYVNSSSSKLFFVLTSIRDKNEA